MNLSSTACYRAVQARDGRYDGRFFTCVKTTGIYCRPVCPARPPKWENCLFVPTAAAAQEAGFRPCLRCRPESSPDLDAWRGTSATVSRALKLIEGGALDEGDVAELAERLGVGDRHLRRLFREHLGANPVSVAQTRRILLAKQLLHQTDLAMIDVAMASGFGSVRRFNETFQALYAQPPRLFRRGKTVSSRAAEISLLLPYRPPYDWAAMMEFLRRRAIAGVERVEGETYLRVIETESEIGLLRVVHEAAQNALRVEVRFPRWAALPVIIARVRRMFDLSADPGAIAAVLSADPLLRPLVERRPGLRVPGGWDGFEIAVRAILGQQITVNASIQLAGRLAAAAGTPWESGLPGLNRAFPRPEAVSAAALKKLGVPKTRASALAGLASAACLQPRLFDPRPDLATAVSDLRKLPGIGEWTAQYIAMRALGECDAFLAADVAVQKSCAQRGENLPASALLARAEQWRPWRAYAVLHLWTALSDPSPHFPH